MPEQEAADRAHNFSEVNLGFTENMARLEAMRCLECKTPTCMDGCPVGVEIDLFVSLVAEGHFAEAALIVKLDNSLPAICGRVCPQENQCEGACVLTKKGESVAIGALERFVADYERLNDLGVIEVPAYRTGKKVAIVGSGPAGLACATDLAKAGHDVTVFEALHELGGVLVYGIPEFRLPKEIVRAEIDGLRQMGVEFITNAVIGQTTTINALLGRDGFDAVFLGVGAGLPKFTNIDGENLIGVYSANEFLTRVNLMRAYEDGSNTPIFDVRGKKVAVFGGGNTAMDAVRTALRLGAAEASIIYRRAEEQMPARVEEIIHAKDEGVVFKLLTSPLSFSGTDDGWLTSARLQQMELGKPDDSGRRRPVPVEGGEYEIDVDVAVIAIGNDANPLLRRNAPGLAFTKWGTVVADEASGRTTKKSVWAGGDIVTGGATVILAMGAGRRAAADINRYLTNGDFDQV
ncbi:MAG: NADPH-dependent glutamate synthase [Acidimicrobiia bacterium]|nr:NADPH-dependent glutamate synthase [Acidimicrobiia bacterium]